MSRKRKQIKQHYFASTIYKASLVTAAVKIKTLGRHGDKKKTEWDIWNNTHTG